MKKQFNYFGNRKSGESYFGIVHRFKKYQKITFAKTMWPQRLLSKSSLKLEIIAGYEMWYKIRNKKEVYIAFLQLIPPLHYNCRSRTEPIIQE